MNSRARQHHGPHHIIPRSRGGEKGDNIYPPEKWPAEEEKHRYWHILFSNMLPGEAIRKIRKYMKRDGALRPKFFSRSFRVRKPWKNRMIKPKIDETESYNKIDKKKEAWRIVFGDMNGLEAIEWIECEFIRKEWLKN